MVTTAMAYNQGLTAAQSQSETRQATNNQVQESYSPVSAKSLSSSWTDVDSSPQCKSESSSQTRSILHSLSCQFTSDLLTVDLSSSILKALLPEYEVGQRQGRSRSTPSPVNPTLEAWLQSEEPHESFAAGFGSRRGNTLEKIDSLLRDLECMVSGPSAHL